MTLRECPMHPRAVRCAHRDGEHLVLMPTEFPRIYELTLGYDHQRGSMTAPVDEARKDMAFEEWELRYLRKGGQ